MMDHAVFDPNCAVCIASKKTRKQHRSKKNRKKITPVTEPPKGFGDKCTCDPFSFNAVGEEDLSTTFVGDHSTITNGTAMYDVGTDFREVYLKTSKSEEHKVEAFNEWCGAHETIKEFYCDNAPELKAAARKVGWRMLAI